MTETISKGGTQAPITVTGTPEQEKAKAWAESKTLPGGYTCPVCGHDKWAILDGPMTLCMWKPGRACFSSPQVPVFGLICEDCGYLRLFSALMTGVVTVPEPEPLPAPEAEAPVAVPAVRRRWWRHQPA